MIGKMITDGLVRGKVIGEGFIGNKCNPIDCWKILILSGHETGKVSAIPKEYATIFKYGEQNDR